MESKRLTLTTIVSVQYTAQKILYVISDQTSYQNVQQRGEFDHTPTHEIIVMSREIVNDVI